MFLGPIGIVKLLSKVKLDHLVFIFVSLFSLKNLKSLLLITNWGSLKGSFVNFNSDALHTSLLISILSDLNLVLLAGFNLAFTLSLFFLVEF